jgi:hypothetical protein
MSTETPVIRNFKGLEHLENFVSKLRLILNQGFGQQVVLEPDDTRTVMPGDLRDLGISLKCEVSSVDLLAAIGHAQLQASDVDLVVIAEGRFLKDREILMKVNSLSFEESLGLVPWKGPRPDALLDRRHGFDVHINFVLNKHIDHQPLRPRRLGTVLAGTTFAVRPNKLGSGFVPRPLTDEVRGDRLPKGTVLWVEQLGDLFTSESLDEAVTIYIDEELHSDIGRLRSPEAKMLQTKLAIEALGQIVYLASLELATRDVTGDDEQSVLGKFLHTQLQNVGGFKVATCRDALLRIKSDPSLVCAQLTAQHRYKQMIRSFLIDETE